MRSLTALSSRLHLSSPPLLQRPYKLGVGIREMRPSVSKAQTVTRALSLRQARSLRQKPLFLL